MMPGRKALTVLIAAGLVGCAGRGEPLLRPELETLPLWSPLRSASLEEGDAWLRHHLMVGEHEQALEVVNASRVAASDRLVRALQEGLLLRAAGEFRRSNAALEWAEAEADRRYTRSASRALASLAVNDRTMAYTPTPAELVMIPYYRMLNHLALDDREGALVEARKANSLLARMEREPSDRCRTDGMVLYLAGLVQRAAGERNDALVSLRQAERAFAGCGEAPDIVGADVFREAEALGVLEVADSIAQRYAFAATAARSAPTGDLLLLIEEGFVAHRAAQSIRVPIFPEEVEGLDGEESDAVAIAAGSITERLLRDVADGSAWNRSWKDQRVVHWGPSMEATYVLRLAWPVVRQEPLRARQVRVLVDDSVAAVHPVGDVSAVVEREIGAERPAMLARLVARGLTKYLLTKELERKAEKEGGEALGFLAGRLANLAANELERADTRSWSLLPDRVSMARLRLAPGLHRVRLETVGDSGAILSTRDLGIVEIRAGELVARSERVWTTEVELGGEFEGGFATRAKPPPQTRTPNSTSSVHIPLHGVKSQIMRMGTRGIERIPTIQ